MKELTLDEISLLEEMKSNCLKKGQYIDDKAKDKFKMLCHLEDFSIAYYELLDVIKEVREWAKKCSCQFTNDDGELVVSEISFNIQARPCDLFKILDKVSNNE